MSLEYFRADEVARKGWYVIFFCPQPPLINLPIFEVKLGLLFFVFLFLVLEIY